MRTRVICDVSVRQSGFKADGWTQWVDRELVAFFLPGRPLRRGFADMRVKLHGTATSVVMKARILTVDKDTGVIDTLYSARITEMRQGHRDRWNAWFDELTTAPTSKPVETSSVVAAKAAGRTGLGGALKEGLDRARAAKSAPAGPVYPPSYNLASDSSSLTVEWDGWASVAATWKAGLSGGKLEVPTRARHPPPGWDMMVRLNLPDGSRHVAAARLKVSQGNFMHLEVSLKDRTRSAIENEVGAP